MWLVPVVCWLLMLPAATAQLGSTCASGVAAPINLTSIIPAIRQQYNITEEHSGTSNVVYIQGTTFINYGLTTVAPSFTGCCASVRTNYHVWFEVHTPRPVVAVIDTCLLRTNYDSTLCVLSCGSPSNEPFPCNSTSVLATSDDACSGRSSRVSVNFSSCVKVRVGGFASSAGRFTLRITYQDAQPGSPDTTPLRPCVPEPPPQSVIPSQELPPPPPSRCAVVWTVNMTAFDPWVQTTFYVSSKRTRTPANATWMTTYLHSTLTPQYTTHWLRVLVPQPTLLYIDTCMRQTSFDTTLSLFKCTNVSDARCTGLGDISAIPLYADDNGPVCSGMRASIVYNITSAGGTNCVAFMVAGYGNALGDYALRLTYQCPEGVCYQPVIGVPPDGGPVISQAAGTDDGGNAGSEPEPLHGYAIALIVIGVLAALLGCIVWCCRRCKNAGGAPAPAEPPAVAMAMEDPAGARGEGQGHPHPGPYRAVRNADEDNEGQPEGIVLEGLPPSYASAVPLPVAVTATLSSSSKPPPFPGSASSSAPGMRTSPFPAPSEPTTISTACKVCMERQMNAAVLPCGHFAMCQQCATQLQAMRAPCPMCRGSIQSVIPIFV